MSNRIKLRSPSGKIGPAYSGVHGPGNFQFRKNALNNPERRDRGTQARRK